PGLSFAGNRLAVTRRHRWGFRVALSFLCRHAVATTPAEPLVGSRSLPWNQRQRPSPLRRRVGFRITCFEACSTFIHVTAYLLAESPRSLSENSPTSLRYLRCSL